MAWTKPDDLALVAECETLPEAEIIVGLLATAEIGASIVSTTDTSMEFAQKSIFGKLAKPLPHKVLVHPDDEKTALELLDAEPEPSEDVDG